MCHNNDKKFKLMLRKGVYPYEYMDSWEKFNEPVPLDKECYYSELNNENISDSDLNHVKMYVILLKKIIWVDIMIYMLDLILLYLLMSLKTLEISV